MAQEAKQAEATIKAEDAIAHSAELQCQPMEAFAFERPYPSAR